MVSLQEYERVRATYSPPLIPLGPMAHMSLKTVREGPHMSTKSALRADLDAEDG
jgi:hypothetical protein